MSTSEDQFAAHFVDQMLAIFMQHNPGRIQSNENALIDAIAASDSFNVNLIECLKDIACKKAYQQIDTFTAEMWVEISFPQNNRENLFHTSIVR